MRCFVLGGIPLTFPTTRGRLTHIRGGIRVIYYWAVAQNVVLMITAYSKNEKEDLTGADKAEIRKIVERFQVLQ